MSYPPGPNGPYGNNPYGQQPTQPQQPYGYPQQPPQGPGPGYGYPPQASTPPPGYGQPALPGAQPGKVNGVKIMMIVVGLVQSLFSLTFILIAFIAGNSIDDVTDEMGTGLAVIILFFALSLVHGAFGVLIGTQFGKMGNGGRTGSIVWASLLILFGIFGLAMYGMGVFWIAIAITCIALLNAPESKAYFNRPQY